MCARVVVFALFFVAFSVSCGGGNPAQPAPVLTATLRGVVHIIPTGPPIAGVSVTVQGQTATTAADGSFSFSGLAIGATSVTLQKDGYARGDLQLTLTAGDNFFSLGMAPAQ
jgi:hypothetical protein